MNSDIYPQVMDMTVDGFKASLLEYVPPSAFRDFYLWALSDENPAQEAWMYALGIPQFVQLTLGLLEDFLTDENRAQVLQYIVPMNVYLMYEVASDDLAIGLATPSLNDPTWQVRRHLLYAFNQAAQDRLKGSPLSTQYQLRRLQMSARSVSGFEQSLNPDKHRTIANIYLSQRPELSMADLEFNLWPRLVANIETCLEVTRQVAGFKVGPLVLQGLTNRYAAVNSLLDEPASALPRLVHIGVDTILVEPTLAYYVGILGEAILGLEHFDSIVDEGLLPEALYYAAFMVRFLNDLGPVLLTQTEFDRSTFIYMLSKPYATSHNANQSLLDVLENASNGLRPYLTRIRKDILHGEFNICLYGIAHLPASQAIPVLEQRLNYLSTLYTQAEARLAELLDQISDRLGDPTISHLIMQFVRFHEHIYRHEHDEPVGEYTV